VDDFSRPPTEPGPRAPTTASSTAIGYPTIGRPVAKEDWFLLWGPLGVMCAMLLALVGILWKRILVKDEMIAALNLRIAGIQDENADRLATMAKEHAMAFQQTAEKGQVLASSIRDVIEAAGKKIIR
jgi:hypothetical protein